MRDFQLPGRSPVRVTEAAAATSHPAATLIAVEVLRAGGNAIDAAIAANAVLAVVEPQCTGLGGDGYMLYAPKGGPEVIGYVGAGRAPAAATADWYRERGFAAMPVEGAHAVTLPGMVDMCVQVHADHGSLELDRLLAPAVRYAENGYVVADRVAADWAIYGKRCAIDPVSAAVYLPGGRSPRAGEIHRQPQLAETLRRIGRAGRAGFYEGPVAQDMVEHLNALGGLHTLEDFAAVRGEYVAPVSTDYRGTVIHEIPPSNQGMTALIMLNVLAGFDHAGLDPNGAERLHLEVEASRLAYRDRNALFADPSFANVPIAELLSPAYAERLQRLISPDRAMTDLPPPLFMGSDTVYLSVVDRDRNAVSFITSISHAFGSGVTAPRSGVLLQNRASGFRLDPGHPNVIAPGKRPFHTIMPGMAMREGRVFAPFGVMGGDYQPVGHAHLMSNMIDFGMDVQEAIDAPRVLHDGTKILAERGVPAATVEGLRARGHQVVEAPQPHGGAQAIIIDWQAGTLTAGSESRKDGTALGY